MGDPQQEEQKRSKNISGIKVNIVVSLKKMPHRNNTLIRSFKTALEIIPPDSKKYKVNIWSVKQQLLNKMGGSIC